MGSKCGESAMPECPNGSRSSFAALSSESEFLAVFARLSLKKFATFCLNDLEILLRFWEVWPPVEKIIDCLPHFVLKYFSIMF